MGLDRIHFGAVILTGTRAELIESWLQAIFSCSNVNPIVGTVRKKMKSCKAPLGMQLLQYGLLKRNFAGEKAEVDRRDYAEGFQLLDQ